MTDLEKITRQIEKGQTILEKANNINNRDEYDQISSQRYTWDNQNDVILSDVLKGKYKKVYSSPFSPAIFGGVPLREEIKELVNLMNNTISSLKEIYSMIEEMEPQNVQASSPSISVEDKKHIFIVHGHDGEMTSEVSILLGRLGLKTTILKEEASQGDTIIEKLERYADKSSAAIILLSPDDVGYASNQNSSMAKARARQNVVLELGLFMGKLGRKRVMALYKEPDHGEFEKPSDIDGLVYIKHSGEWRFQVGKELKAMGFDVDMNKLI